jgi:hypothetical protein
MSSEKVGESTAKLSCSATHLYEPRACGLFCFCFRGVDLGVAIAGFFVDLTDFFGQLFTFWLNL